VIEEDQNVKRRGVIALVYTEVLHEYLPTILEADSVFIQDNALIYKAFKVRDFLINIGVDVID
jgi:hypothetical protein